MISSTRLGKRWTPAPTSITPIRAGSSIHTEVTSESTPASSPSSTCASNPTHAHASTEAYPTAGMSIRVDEGSPRLFGVVARLGEVGRAGENIGG